MPTFASSFGATACGTATESLLSALLEIKLRLLPELDAVCPPSRRQIGPSSYDLHRFRSSNHILSAWARREERAFAHPTDCSIARSWASRSRYQDFGYQKKKKLGEMCQFRPALNWLMWAVSCMPNEAPVGRADGRTVPLMATLVVLKSR